MFENIANSISGHNWLEKHPKFLLAAAASSEIFGLSKAFGENIKHRSKIMNDAIKTSIPSLNMDVKIGFKLYKEEITSVAKWVVPSPIRQIILNTTKWIADKLSL